MLEIEDNSGKAILKFSKSCYNNLVVGSVYQLLGICMISPDPCQFMFEASFSYALIKPKSKKFVGIKVNHPEPFTTKDLQKIDKNNVHVKGPMMLQLESVFPEKQSKGKSKCKYRRAIFRDEFNNVALGAFAEDCKKYDEWKVGSHYTITDFKTNLYKNPKTQKTEINISWVNGRTTVNLAEDGTKRFNDLQSINTEFDGTILGYSHYYNWKSCMTCSKTINLEKAKFLQHFYEGGKILSQSAKCRCGQEISPSMKLADEFCARIVFQNDGAIKFYGVTTYNQHLVLFRQKLEAELGHVMTDEQFLERLTGQRCRVICEDYTKDGEQLKMMKQLIFKELVFEEEDDGVEEEE